MHVVRKAVSFFLLTMASAIMLAACKGGSSTTTASATPPTGSYTYAPTSSSTPLSIVFTATGHATADSNPVTYAWNFGDQTVSGSTQATTGSPVTHVYSQPGIYDVTLTIADDHGTSVNTFQTITLLPSGSGTGMGVENWSWLGGGKYADSAGTFETEFQPDAKNVPSARQYSATWISGGKLWMFGGAGYDSTGTVGALSDLWNCTPPVTTGSTIGNCVWTWVAGPNKANAAGVYPSSAGTFSAVSTPGGRSAAATWTDLNGNMWLFGGAGFDASGNSGLLDDMWSFSVAGQSEWVSGSKTYNDQGNATTPQARAYAMTWTDSYGNFWMFGGQSVNSSGTTVYLDDLWCFTPGYSNLQSTPGVPNGSATHPLCYSESDGGSKAASAGQPITSGTWTLVAGGTVNGAGVYTAGTTDIPGARINAQTWVDGAGNLWMFGGSGYDANGSNGSLSDVWRYDPIKKAWAFKAGVNGIGATEVVGTRGSYATANTPSARLGTIGWTAPDGTTLWMFGGSGTDSTATTSSSDGGGALNELWAFNTATNQWAFVAGTTSSTTGAGGVAGSAGIFQTQGTLSTYGIPGSRLWSNLWVDSSNNVWIFGGTGEDVVGTSGYLNDLWLIKNPVVK